MRFFASIFLLALSSLASAVVTDKAIDLSGAKSTLIAKVYTETLTSTQQTLTVTIGSEDRRIAIYTRSYEWGFCHDTGNYSTKSPFDAKQVDTVTIVASEAGGTTTRVFYWQAASTTDTIYVVVVE